MMRWLDSVSYRVVGEYLQDENSVMFHLIEAVVVGNIIIDEKQEER
jgi:hypothetical protein